MYRPGPVALAAAALALASCGADPTCKSLGAEELPLNACFLPQFTQDRTDLCVSVAESGSLAVGLYVGCNGFDVISYPTIDTGEFALYRPPDDRLVGVGSWGPLGATHATIDGTPQPFDFSSCTETSSVRCAPP